MYSLKEHSGDSKKDYVHTMAVYSIPFQRMPSIASDTSKDVHSYMVAKYMIKVYMHAYVLYVYHTKVTMKQKRDVSHPKMVTQWKL